MGIHIVRLGAAAQSRVARVRGVAHAVSCATHVLRSAVIAVALLGLGCSALEGSPGKADAGATATPPEVDPSAPTLLQVRADDGHVLALWAKAPEQPRGAIVLLHGRTWSGRPDFDLQVPGEQRSTMDALVREGFAAYALDLRGYGRTERDASGWNTPDRAAKDLAAALELVAKRHDGHAPAVLGWSLGSLTAQLVAQRRPELVSALVLYGYPRSPDSVYVPPPPPEPGKKPPPEPVPLREPTTAEAAAEDFIVPGAISPRAIETFVAAALAADPVKTDWRAPEQWAELDPAKVQVPVMVIHGEADPYAPVESQATLFERLGHPDRQWVIVAGGDHAAHLENSGSRFVHAIVTFLDRPR
jgi:pimeloyl-ACP methyl ester carboxylesterase